MPYDIKLRLQHRMEFRVHTNLINPAQRLIVREIKEIQEVLE